MNVFSLKTLYFISVFMQSSSKKRFIFYSLLVANSYLQILFNKESLGIQRSQLDIANEELVIAQERLKSGIIPKGDVLEIEANVAAMNQRVVVAENNYLLSKIALASGISIEVS